MSPEATMVIPLQVALVLFGLAAVIYALSYGLEVYRRWCVFHAEQSQSQGQVPHRRPCQR